MMESSVLVIVIAYIVLKREYGSRLTLERKQTYLRIFGLLTRKKNDTHARIFGLWFINTQDETHA